MSSIYVLEPPTRGKVVLQTTYGPLDIELWPKEAPKAARNFVQLCLEGYYDNTVFHRIIKGFLVQGGTATGEGGESIYGGVFADEFHSRLRFKHRGLVACANANKPNTNGSQFFMNLDRCDWLDKKHTIFGKVTGDSIYNLVRLGEIETDKEDRPLDPPPRIKSVEVLWNPFDDIVPRLLKSLVSSTDDTDKKDTKKKGVKKLNLLSFGEEAEEEENELAAIKTKIKSSHDVLDDPRLLKDEVSLNEMDPKTRQVQLSVREALNSKKEEPSKDSESKFYNSHNHSDDDDDDDDGDEANFDSRMRHRILKKQKELGDLPPKPKLQNGSSSPKQHETSTTRSKAESSDDDQPKVEKLSLKKKGIGSEAKAERLANADADLQLLNEAERGRQLQKQKKRRNQGREDETIARLEKFKKTLTVKATPLPDSESGGGNDEDLSDWKKVGLKFAPETGKMTRTEDINDYVVLDPLLEKGKEKFNRMQAKAKRREREWAGKSLT